VRVQMALSIIFAREGLRTKMARMAAGCTVCCQMACHVFRIAKSHLACRTSVGVHLGSVMGFSVVPATWSVESHLWNSWSPHLRPDAKEKILLHGKQTWRAVASLLLEGPALALTTKEPNSSDAVDPDSVSKLETLRCTDRSDLVVGVEVAPCPRAPPACVTCCEVCVDGDGYCCVPSLLDHTLGGGGDTGALSTL
jgi:hypothetical protein